MFLRLVKLFSLFLITTIFLTGCSLPFKKKKQEAVIIKDDPVVFEETKRTNGMKKFKDYDEIASFLATNNKGVLGFESEESLSPVAFLDYFKENASNNPREGDILKQANDFVFLIIRNQVIILRTTVEENLLLKKIDFVSAPQGLLLSGKRLVVYGYDDILSKKENSDFYFIKIFDLSFPTEATLINDYSFEGSLNNIFIEENNLYLLTETKINSQVSRRNIPRVLEANKLLSTSCDGIEKCFAPEVFYFDSNYSEARFFNINIIDLQNEFSSLIGQSYLLSEDHKVFSSNASIFITYSESLNSLLLEFEAKRELIYPLLSLVEKEKVDEFEALSDLILSQEEKRIKTSLILDDYLDNLLATDKALLKANISSLVQEKKKANNSVSNKTLVYKIRIDKNNLDYFAKAEILGNVFNQSSLIQEGNYFYLATRGDDGVNSDGELRYYSNIYIFDLKLRLVGKMENMASKEEIYGVRFLGNRAYLISAEENASLFVVSLENKSKPEFSGSLKLFGENNYLRPVDKNGEKFISFSYDKREADGEEVGGLRLSLLDFSDLKTPKELDSYLIGDSKSDSLAFTDRDSFFYSPSSKILAFPAVLREFDRLYFSGHFTFALENNKFEMLGQVDHSAGGFYNQTENFLDKLYLDNSVKRSFVVNNLIHSFSNKFFRSAKLREFEEISFLELTFHSDDFLVSSFQTKNDLIKEDNDLVLEEHYLIEEIENELTDTGNNLEIPNYFGEEGFLEDFSESEVYPEIESENNEPDLDL